MPLPHGQIIMLKPGSEETYIILHKNIFPGVLSRIARSNITNYSIYLHDGLLFGYYEYCGRDFCADMKAMSEDISTQEWWKLTAPMQQPIPDRNPEDWWTDLCLVFEFNDPYIENKIISRHGFIFSTDSISHDAGLPLTELDDEKILALGLHKLLIFSGKVNSFIYIEKESEGPVEALSQFFQSFAGIGKSLSEMKEVFHTDGIPEVEKKKKVFVTGCFDMLHSGHIEFLREASSFGKLFVCIGSDANVTHLKGRRPVNSQKERKYMLSAIRHVYMCLINKGWGIMDFMEEIEEIRPDIYVVNEDGNTPDKAALCKSLGIEYKVLKRIPHEGLPARSTTSLRAECQIPYRIDLAGGWLDQPFVSKCYPGPVITISIEPTIEFNDRSGMATSTRRKAIELWQTVIPPGNPKELARLLFSFDNPPGTQDVSGSQDALGIVLPGLNKLSYNSEYWPKNIISVHREDILSWLENHLYLLTLGPRHADYHVVEYNLVSPESAKQLSGAAERCWDAIMLKDIRTFGKAFRDSFEAQVSMFPNMADDNIMKIIELYEKRAYGWKLSGAGGGGYLILVSDVPVEGAIRIKIRRNEGL
jgi:cytidyltransferase-like protein